MGGDRELIESWSGELGSIDIARVNRWSRLAGAASGSTVYRLEFDRGSPVVLKVNARPVGEGAKRELRFYQQVAADLPVRTPRLIAGTTTSEGSCLVLSVADPSPPAADWKAGQWIEVARQLGRLHRPAVASRLAHHSWLGWRTRPTATRVSSEPTELRRLWRSLGQQPAADPLLDVFDELAAAVKALPICLLHGDCHAGNLLIDPVDGELVWTDWQEAGFGRGPEDLALLWQRGEFDGGLLPRNEMLAVYAAARGIPEDSRLRRAVIGAEARLVLSSWPPFLRDAPPSRREVIFRRLGALAHEWTA